ncbi:MAG: metallophosphoesterase [Ignavibacteriales bacterium]|nr:metallophosphoesterase [Ignavibacteriales bacterium]
MKLLAFTDIHGSYERVERAMVGESPFSAVIVGGDLTTNGTPAEAERAVKLFQKKGAPVFVVAGNMDPPELEKTFIALDVSINARGVLLDDVGLFGVSASPVTPMHTPYEISEEEIALRAHAGWKDVQAARIRIFVPHAPPHNTSVDLIKPNNHVGSTAIRKFIEQCQPDVTICGHIHEARGLDTIGKTRVVNCGPAGRGYYAVISIGKETSVELKG